MKQFGIYIAAALLMTACANQGNLASYDDDGIYARPGKKQATSATPADAYYFVDEEPQADGQYYGSEDHASAGEDDYVAEAKSLPSESGRAYSSQRYNSPTYYAAYTSHVPVTMRLGYSSFHDPFAYGGGFGVSVGYGYGFYDPWWGYYDPWNPWYRPHPWGRSWYSWNTWHPYGYYGYGMGYGAGYAHGYSNGYYHGVNSYNNNYWGEHNSSQAYTGRRPAFGGGSFGTTPPGTTGPRGRSTFESPQRTPAQSGRDIRGIDRDRSRTTTPERSPTRENPAINNRRPVNPNATRRPADSRDNRQDIRWGNGSRTPDMNRGGSTQPGRQGVTPPARGNDSYTRPSAPSRNNYSQPAAPSRNNTMSRPSTPSRNVAPSSPSPSRSSGSSGGSRGNSTGGRR